VVGVSALHDIAPLVAGSHWDHGGFWWFPFALLWVVVLGTAIWFVARMLRPRERSGLERAREILPSGTPVARSAARSTESVWTS
jgi:hypothetical protein